MKTLINDRVWGIIAPAMPTEGNAVLVISEWKLRNLLNNLWKVIDKAEGADRAKLVSISNIIVESTLGKDAVVVIEGEGKSDAC